MSIENNNSKIEQLTNGFLLQIEDVSDLILKNIDTSEAQELLIDFYQENGKHISDFIRSRFFEFANKIDYRGASFYSLGNSDSETSVYRLNLNEVREQLSNQAIGDKVVSAEFVIELMDNQMDPNPNISQQAKSIATIFRLLNLKLQNYCFFNSPTLAKSLKNAVFKAPIEIRIVLDNGTVLSKRIFSDENKYDDSFLNFDTKKCLLIWAQFNPNIALHFHMSQVGESADIISLSKYSFEKESLQFMQKYSDVYLGSPKAIVVTNFRTIDFFHGSFLCVCLDTNSYFIIEFFSEIISRFETEILEQTSLSEVIEVPDELLLNLSFNLNTDFIIVEDADEIKTSLNRLVKIIVDDE